MASSVHFSVSSTATAVFLFSLLLTAAAVSASTATSTAASTVTTTTVVGRLELSGSVACFHSTATAMLRRHVLNRSLKSTEAHVTSNGAVCIGVNLLYNLSCEICICVLYSSIQLQGVGIWDCPRH